MEEGSVTVLVDAKEEYTKQLISILKQCIYQGIKSIYLDAKDICNQDNTPEKVLMVFQDLLSRIPKWSQDIINKEYERIMNVSKCDYIEDLLKVIYVSHIKVLTIIHSAQKNKKITLKVPNGGHFMHLCYIECAREFWKDPYLFSENVNKYEIQKNMRDSELMIAECIAETIRKQLPVRHILKEYLNEPDEDIEEAEEDIKDPINKKYLKKLESVVKKELKSTDKKHNSNEIDLELIRKVIREELNSRPTDTSSTGIIKKELVDTVIEKIVEQTNEPVISNISTPDKDNIPEVIKESLDKENVSLDKENVSLDKENVSLDKENIPEVIKESLDKENIPEVIKESLDKENVSLDKENVSEVVKESLNKSEVVKESLNKSEVVKESLDKEEEIISNSNNINDLVNAPLPISRKENILKINNIDEINLNLDELDDDLQIDKDNDLEEVDINSMSKQIETKPDTSKYIFFNDT